MWERGRKRGEGEREGGREGGIEFGEYSIIYKSSKHPLLYSPTHTHMTLPNILMDVPKQHTPSVAGIVASGTPPTVTTVLHQSLSLPPSLPPPPCASGTRVYMHACSGGGHGGVALSWRAV